MKANFSQFRRYEGKGGNAPSDIRSPPGRQEREAAPRIARRPAALHLGACPADRPFGAGRPRASRPSGGGRRHPRLARGTRSSGARLRGGGLCPDQAFTRTAGEGRAVGPEDASGGGMSPGDGRGLLRPQGPFRIHGPARRRDRPVSRLRPDHHLDHSIDAGRAPRLAPAGRVARRNRSRPARANSRSRCWCG